MECVRPSWTAPSRPTSSPTGSPIGATIPFRDSSAIIVGVVEQARQYDLHQDGRPQVYLRAEDWDFASRTLSFAVRTSRPPDDADS